MQQLSEAYDLRASERFCREMARREAKNFYWGFISLPYDQRVAIYALYDFARQIDDEADSAGAPADRAVVAARLQAHRARIRRAIAGKYDDQVMHVLSHAIERYGIPESELMMLIDGVECDLTKKRYATWEELRGYCTLVASVVGRMCVRVFGFSDPVALERADDLGLALQLTNILRDVREDAELGRIYLPAEDLNRFGLNESAIDDLRPSPQWNELIAFETQRARSLFESGYKVLEYIPRRSAVCVGTMAGIYERILEKIERDPELPLRERARLTRTEKLQVMIASWLRVG
jgi:15-cis-phytoene synthase